MARLPSGVYLLAVDHSDGQLLHVWPPVEARRPLPAYRVGDECAQAQDHAGAFAEDALSRGLQKDVMAGR